jgi:hypothetical protein
MPLDRAWAEEHSRSAPRPGRPARRGGAAGRCQGPRSQTEAAGPPAASPPLWHWHPAEDAHSPAHARSGRSAVSRQQQAWDTTGPGLTGRWSSGRGGLRRVPCPASAAAARAAWPCATAGDLLAGARALQDPATAARRPSWGGSPWRSRYSCSRPSMSWARPPRRSEPTVQPRWSASAGKAWTAEMTASAHAAVAGRGLPLLRALLQPPGATWAPPPSAHAWVR